MFGYYTLFQQYVTCQVGAKWHRKEIYIHYYLFLLNASSNLGPLQLCFSSHFAPLITTVIFYQDSASPAA